jgi:ankyrin repeat protein
LGSIEVVELLIRKGATVNSITSQQKHSMPVMIAAAAGHADVVQILIDHGADLTIKNGGGNTVLEIAIAGGHSESVALLLEVLGGDDYPQESIAIDIAMATSIPSVKAVMTETGLIRLYTNEESATPPSTYRALIDHVLREGGELIKPYALSSMMSVALYEKELAVVIALLAYGYNPNQYLASGQTPLHIAIIQWNIRLVEVLLEYGANPVLPTRNLEGPDYTPLHQAFISLDSDQDRDTSIVHLLLETGQCTLMTGENARSTAFDYVLSHYSMWDHGVAEIMTFRMLQFALDIHTDCSDDGSTLMHSAVWYGRADLTKILISKGLNINVPNARGNTPFLVECQRNTRLLRFLINNGANAYARNNDGQTALHAAASKGQIGVISFLFHLGLRINDPDNIGNTPFTWAVICGQEDAALHLLNLGAKISPEELRPRRTLLHLAAEFNMSRLLPKFLDIPSLRVQVNSKDKQSIYPLETAARYADKDIVEALLDAGANIHGKALHMALKYGNVGAARCLIERGADVKSNSKYGFAPLHVADDVGIVELLIERGADVNGFDRDGLTPLVHCRDADIARLLITHGADVEHKDGNGWTCLHRTVREGNVDMFRVLLRAGADVAVRTTDDGLDVRDRIEDVEDEEVRVAFEQMVACVDLGPGLL